MSLKPLIKRPGFRALSRFGSLSVLLLSQCLSASAKDAEAADNDETHCILQLVNHAADSLTVEQIKQRCSEEKQTDAGSQEEDQVERKVDEVTPALPTGAISQRIIQEKETEFNPYVITPHKMTYILPVMTTNEIHRSAYESLDGYQDNLENTEAKFQISLKVPLNNDSLLLEHDALYLGFTLQAWWQIYAQGISRPFRETNYQPEIFYLAPLDLHPFGGNIGFMLGIEHQSNGRGAALSRSWNRVYLNLLYEKDNFALSFKPWIRLSEKAKQYELDPDGDDNPDIGDYMGHFELGMVYKWESVELAVNGRRNFVTDKGYLELGLTFPLWGKLRGFATASNGYGESLIDYNYKQTRFGLGIALNNVL